MSKISFYTPKTQTMKKILVASFALISVAAFARWGWEKLEGNGVLRKERREVSAFTALSSKGSIDVALSYGSSNTIEVEADENLLPFIETTVDGGKLTVKFKDNKSYSTRNPVKVTVQMTRVEGLSVSGSGDITGDGAFTNEGTSKFSVSGSGSIDIGYSKFGNVEAAISGSGDIRLKNGTARRLDAVISGSGKVDANKSSYEDVTAKISGSGHVKAKANNSVDAKIAGSGNVYYTGAATKVSSHAAGSGKLIRSAE